METIIHPAEVLVVDILTKMVGHCYTTADNVTDLAQRKEYLKATDALLAILKAEAKKVK